MARLDQVIGCGTWARSLGLVRVHRREYQVNLITGLEPGKGFHMMHSDLCIRCQTRSIEHILTTTD